MLYNNKNIPSNLLYTKDHEWISKQDINNDGYFFVGITHYAQEQLGDIVFLDISCNKKNTKKNNIIGEIESVKSVSNIMSPVDGYISEVNNIVLANPELINIDPFNRGWICKFKVKNLLDLSDLLSYKEYSKYLESLV